MYSESVLDHFHHPRNVGAIENATVTIEMTNPVCGDLMKLSAAVHDGRIVEAKFQTQGCIPAVACGSWLTEAMKGKSPAELASITPAQIEAALGGLPSASQHAARLAADALHRLLQEIKPS
jgi:NifU-like protein involved in Fe-S cluster formation